ncbi:hypothetical protein EYF80_034940 [Liparis tanakae]|uniref:Uncharacterized protein n=1 Tax=Liparis tanakae TaxID=230148 RepID=A0A4Z2GNG7_9TELE|nr:hypothetical protein EYF80_034940 [Liparis tanakae]
MTFSDTGVLKVPLPVNVSPPVLNSRHRRGGLNEIRFLSPSFSGLWTQPSRREPFQSFISSLRPSFPPKQTKL